VEEKESTEDTQCGGRGSEGGFHDITIQQPIRMSLLDP
jgi:hypothetical protein